MTRSLTVGSCLALTLCLVGCGDDSVNDGVGGTTASTSTTGTSVGSTSGSGSGSTSTGSAMGTGSCLSPRDVSLGFTADASATTADQLDTATLDCNTNGSQPEVVYRLTLSAMTTVHLTAGDHSGQGVGVSVRQDSCDGQSVGCDFASNGVLDRSYPLPAGVWVFVVERNPPGPFTLTVGP